MPLPPGGGSSSDGHHDPEGPVGGARQPGRARSTISDSAFWDGRRRSDTAGNAERVADGVARLDATKQLHLEAASWRTNDAKQALPPMADVTMGRVVIEQIVVIDYDPQWPRSFELLCAYVWPIVAGVAARIDHVGSTSVPGLAAKPIIDMDIVVRTPADVAPANSSLEAAGFEGQGDLGVAGREAFSPPLGAALPAHHLYLVVEDSRAHADHVLLRDLLREDPVARSSYADLKRRNALQAGADIDFYVAAKAATVAELLTRARRERGLPSVAYWEPELPLARGHPSRDTHGVGESQRGGTTSS